MYQINSHILTIIYTQQRLFTLIGTSGSPAKLIALTMYFPPGLKQVAIQYEYDEYQYLR